MNKLDCNVECDVLVIGSGAAGCAAALAARNEGARVVLLDKGTFSHSGMSGTLPHWYCAFPAGDEDAGSMLEDARREGCELADDNALELVAGRSRQWLDRLEDWGAIFNRDASGGIQAVKSGGHSIPRTAWPAYMWTLANQVRRTGIEIKDERATIGLIKSNDGVNGAVALRRLDAAIESYTAGSVVLATGGGGAMFGGDMRVWRSSAPAECTGDGYAMALEAGAELVDMEFVQTVMQPLATDAEGDSMLGDLVVRARRERLQETLEQAPAAHHFLGGVKVDTGGNTGVGGLYACGDAAGGLYGAGRPEAVALQACMVWGSIAGESAAAAAVNREHAGAGIVGEFGKEHENEVSAILSATGNGPRPRELRKQIADALASAMLTPPDEPRLKESLNAVRDVKARLSQVRLLDRSRTYNQELVDAIGLGGVVTSAECVLRSAMLRRESRGVFCRDDYPEMDDEYIGHNSSRLSGGELKVEFRHL